MTDTTASPRNTLVAGHNDLMIASAYEDVLRAGGLDSLDALFAVSEADRLSKPGLANWRERLRLTLDVRGKQETFYLKRFSNPPASTQREIRRSGSGASSVAGTEWTWLNRLATDGIPCATPVAFGERLRGGRELRSAVLTAAVPGRSLEHWVGVWSRGDHPTISRLIRPLAELIARLHKRGYIHRDLYLSHIFHNPTGTVDRSFHLIDLQRVIRPRGLRRRWIVKDLASLNFSAPTGLISDADRLRWLTHYLQVSKLDASARRLVYRVVGKTRRIAYHERRRQARTHARSDRT